MIRRVESITHLDHLYTIGQFGNEIRIYNRGKTENEITMSDHVIIGDVFIGTGETDGMRVLAKAAPSNFLWLLFNGFKFIIFT